MYSPKLRPPMSISNKPGEDSTLFSTRRCLLAWAFIRLIVSLLWTGLLILVTVVTIIHYYDKDAENERDRLLFEVPAIVVQMIEIGMLVTFIVAGFKTLALVAFPMLMYEMVDELTSDKPRGEMRYSDPAVHLPVIVAAALADIVLTVVLLIGAHRKNKLLLKIYFYFATISQLMTLLADLPFYDYTAHRKNAVYLFYVGLNIYLLFLVHNVVYVRKDKREIQYIAYDQHQVTV